MLDGSVFPKSAFIVRMWSLCIRIQTGPRFIISKELLWGCKVYTAFWLRQNWSSTVDTQSLTRNGHPSCGGRARSCLKRTEDLDVLCRLATLKWCFFLACDDLGGMCDHFPPALSCFLLCFLTLGWVTHTNSTLYARISLQWLSELRRLWPNVPWQVVYELFPDWFPTMSTPTSLG